MNAAIQLTAEITPNPNTLKFVVNRKLLEHGSIDYPDREKAQESPLAARVFELPSVAGVFIGTNFVTVTKTPEADWNQLVGTVAETLKDALASGETVVGAAEASEEATDDPVARRVREILDREIRPAVAMDGGDIRFIGYKDGVVTLHLRGSCSSCPSSIMTLKMGVENRLRSEIPEIKEVVQM
jgi:Fe-S cluster biogenesis protein NfuA